MREADAILSKLMSKPVGVHARRHAAVEWAVGGIVRGGRIGLTAIGRAGRSGTTIKHQIKRADRLVGNTLLLADHDAYFSSLADRVIGASRRAVVLIDWTRVGAWYVLAAGVAFEGRSVPILFEVHELAAYNTQQAHNNFVRRLLKILPEGCRPILVTDAGFRGPWVRHLLELGVDFITRVPGCAKLHVDGAWETVDALASRAGPTSSDLGAVLLTTASELPVRSVRAKRFVRSQRRDKRPRRSPKSTRELTKMASQPWVLATSLRATAAEVIRIYGLRMQIEELFRDHKSHRFGLALRYARTASRERLSNLLLLAAIASFVLAVVGMIATARGLAPLFQANTIRERRVLSAQRLARATLASRHHVLIRERSLKQASRRMKTQVRSMAPV